MFSKKRLISQFKSCVSLQADYYIITCDR